MQDSTIPGEANLNIAGQIRQGQMLKGLNKASLAVQQARTPDQVYDAVIEEMGRLGYHTFILEPSFDGQHLLIVRTALTDESRDLIRKLTGWSPDTLRIVLGTLPERKRILEDKEALFIPDMVPFVRKVLPESARPMAKRIADILSLQHSIVAPLEVIGNVKGIVIVSARDLSDADLPAVIAFGRQISAALERTRLFAELQEREWRSTIAYEMAQQYARELKAIVREEQQRRAELDRLNKALRLFAERLQVSHDEQAIAQLLCQAVYDALGWQQAAVLLVDQETTTWHVVAQTGYPPNLLEQQVPHWLLPTDDAPWKREEFRAGHSYYVPDALANLDLEQAWPPVPGQEPSGDLLIVFLEAEGDILGMLVPANREDGQAPTRQQIESLELFGIQAAIAIESNRLSRSVRRWADAVQHSGHAIFITDVAGEILNANPAFEALTGYDLRPGQEGLSLQACLSPRPVYEEMWQTVQRGQIWKGDVIAIRRDGSTYDADLSVAPIVGVSGAIIGYVGSQRDITPMKELDRLKSRFISNVSHELRTPLTNIKLYQRYLREGRRPNMQARFFDILERETNRLEQIIESLLDLSRLETGIRPFRSERVDLGALGSEIVAAHQPAAQARGLSLLFEPSPVPLPVMADRQQMAVVLENLLDNALSYTPEGGTIEVTARKKGDAVLLAVEDSGAGIAPEEIDHVFERFYRGQAAESLGIAGAGLGLSIVKQILELHGGTIEIGDREEGGTIFTVTLPGAGCVSGGSPEETHR